MHYFGCTYFNWPRVYLTLLQACSWPYTLSQQTRSEPSIQLILVRTLTQQTVDPQKKQESRGHRELHSGDRRWIVDLLFRHTMMSAHERRIFMHYTCRHRLLDWFYKHHFYAHSTLFCALRCFTAMSGILCDMQSKCVVHGNQYNIHSCADLHAHWMI